MKGVDRISLSRINIVIKTMLNSVSIGDGQDPVEGLVK